MASRLMCTACEFVLLYLFFVASFAYAGGDGGYGSFSSATCIQPQSDLTAASPAVCPTDTPVGCSSIGAAGYCCPSGNYCAWDNSQVGCCPSGKTCSGSVDETQTTWAQDTWQPTTTTYWQPSQATQWTTHVQVTTTVYGGVDTTSHYTTEWAQSTTAAQSVVYGTYCSTIYAHGSDLPATRAGTCGTVLVVNEGGRLGLLMTPLAALVGIAGLLMQLQL